MLGFRVCSHILCQQCDHLFVGCMRRTWITVSFHEYMTTYAEEGEAALERGDEADVRRAPLESRQSRASVCVSGCVEAPRASVHTTTALLTYACCGAQQKIHGQAWTAERMFPTKENMELMKKRAKKLMVRSPRHSVLAIGFC